MIKHPILCSVLLPNYIRTPNKGHPLFRGLDPEEVINSKDQSLKHELSLEFLEGDVIVGLADPLVLGRLFLEPVDAVDGLCLVDGEVSAFFVQVDKCVIELNHLLFFLYLLVLIGELVPSVHELLGVGVHLSLDKLWHKGLNLNVFLLLLDDNMHLGGLIKQAWHLFSFLGQLQVHMLSLDELVCDFLRDRKVVNLHAKIVYGFFVLLVLD